MTPIVKRKTKHEPFHPAFQLIAFFLAKGLFIEEACYCTIDRFLTNDNNLRIESLFLHSFMHQMRQTILSQRITLILKYVKNFVSWDLKMRPPVLKT